MSDYLKRCLEIAKKIKLDAEQDGDNALLLLIDEQIDLLQRAIDDL